ncbi:MAG: hypothetical protein SFV54_13165 [Bryobacteraceae bacterium]|nr:hypothetical protein [Bryobacteraceae bacterium]
MASVLHGAPLHTYDVDLVYSKTDQNIERLLLFLADIEAIFRIQPHRKLQPNESHLRGNGHLNLLTRYGYLDLLAILEEGIDYEYLIARSSPLDIGEDLTIQVIPLELVIELKERVGGDKDRAVLPLLRATLAESRKKSAD